MWRVGGVWLIVGGGGGGVAESMREFMKVEKVHADKILLENRSVSTRENALFTAALVKDIPGRKVLLTSDFHVYRSVRALKKAGIDVTPRPIPYAMKRANAWMDRWPLFLDLSGETAKIAVYRLRGWI